MVYSQAEEEKNSYIKSMGNQELGILFYELSRELHWARIKWSEYKKLYCNEKYTSLLNRIAPEFFNMVRTVLLETLVMDISRLTDPAVQRGMTNGSIFSLISLSKQKFSEKNIDPKEWEESINAKRKSFDRLRNKRLAHNDLQLMLQSDGTESPITQGEIDLIPESLDELEKLFIRFRELHGLEFFPNAGPIFGESHDLIAALQNITYLPVRSS